LTSGRAAVRLVATAGPHEGRGHVGRALAVAEALAGLGARSEIRLIRGGLTPAQASYANDLGIAIRPLSGGTETDVTYFDLPNPNEATADVEGARTAVMDDRDVFAGQANLVIQPSQPSWTGPGRADRVLEGYGMAPISAEYRRLRAAPRRDRDSSGERHVVACFGGADPARVSQRLVDALAGTGAQVDIIIGASYEGSTDGWPIDPIRDPDDLPERLAAADVAVLAAGTMKFEAACLGLPALLVAVADDQLRAGPPFAATGVADYLGDGRLIPPSAVVDALAALLRDDARREAMGRRAAELIDGRGAERIARALLDLAENSGR